MTDALLQSLNKVDYETGQVVLPDGSKLPFQVAMDHLATLLAKRGKQAAAGGQRDDLGREVGRTKLENEKDQANDAYAPGTGGVANGGVRTISYGS